MKAKLTVDGWEGGGVWKMNGLKGSFTYYVVLGGREGRWRGRVEGGG